MLKRVLILTLALTGLFIAAWSPIATQGAPSAIELQATAPPPGPTIAITLVVPTAMGSTQPTPGTGLPSTVVIGLLVIVGLAVIIGGIALASRGRQA